MEFDRKSLEKLLSLNDRQLGLVINRIAAENGIDPASFNIDPANIASIRSALSGASDEELKKIAEQFDASKRGGKTGK